VSSLNTKNIKVTLIRSTAGRNESQKKTFVSLGLKKIGQSRVLPNLNPILGQVNKVIQWVKVEPAE
jgi:large subunit ribosomal protein L30